MVKTSVKLNESMYAKGVNNGLYACMSAMAEMVHMPICLHG